jgi:hypothetical protein
LGEIYKRITKEDYPNVVHANDPNMRNADDLFLSTPGDPTYTLFHSRLLSFHVLRKLNGS